METIWTKTYPAVANYKGDAKLEVDDFVVSKIVPTAFAVQQIVKATETIIRDNNHTPLKTEVKWRQDSENNYFELNTFYLPAPQVAGMDGEIQSLQPVVLLPMIINVLSIIAGLVAAYIIYATVKRIVDALCDPNDKESCAERLQKVTQPITVGLAAIAVIGAGIIYLAATGKQIRDVI